MPVEMVATKNGPYLVTGNLSQLDLRDGDGNLYDLAGKRRIFLCRCGGSTTKPFCDGPHTKIGFQAAEAAVNDSLVAVRYAERHCPEHLPRTPLDLGDPIGTFTGRRLTALGQEPLRSRQLLKGANIDHRRHPSHTERPHCGYGNAVLVSFGGSYPLVMIANCPSCRDCSGRDWVKE